MKSSSPNQNQNSFLYQGLKEILNPKEPLYQLAERIPWKTIEKAFEKYYVDFGRPAKPTRWHSHHYVTDGITSAA